jgi:hypothetical protein
MLLRVGTYGIYSFSCIQGKCFSCLALHTTVAEVCTGMMRCWQCIACVCAWIEIKVFETQQKNDSMCRGADKSLAWPTFWCFLFDSENISFDASLVVYINSTNIPPIMIVNRIYEKIFCHCSLFPSWLG